MPCTADRSLLFIHIPKTGGTSIEQALGLFGPWQEENQRLLFGLIQSPELLAHGWGSDFLQHLSWREIQQQWEFRGALRFAVVRNPWARFASVFTNTDTNLKQVASQQGINLEGLGFEAFVEATEVLEHAHLRPQLSYIGDGAGALAVDALLHTEHLNQEFAAFAAAHGLVAELPWLNRSAEPGAYKRLYTPASWRRIGERYGQDVASLGYG
jgi:hypothetical protein